MTYPYMLSSLPTAPQVTTDNSATLVNALAEIDRKDAALRVALETLEGLFATPGRTGHVAVWHLGGSIAPREAITTIKEALARQLINRGILQLTRPSRAEFKVVDVVQVPKESP